MKEDDICELLRFERKQLRARIVVLKNDKFLQGRLKMETGPDGKAAKVTCYFINYKTFVNVVKYKLDWMRKRMETTERDATSRASFICVSCTKTFTDLEADQLFDPFSNEFRCTFCGSLVEEDVSAMPQKNSRLLLARFNEQLQPLFELLRAVENIKLAPECLEPEPVDIDTIRGVSKTAARLGPNGDELWSGEATRNQGFAVEETRVDVTIGDDNPIESFKPKDRPIWMTESTVITNDENAGEDAVDAGSSQPSTSGMARNRKENEDIMSVLLQHEKQPNKVDPLEAALKANGSSSDSSGDSSADEQDIENTIIRECWHCLNC